MLNIVVIKEMHIKIMMKCCHTLMRVAKIKKPEIPRVDKDVKQLQLVYCQWECKMVNTFREQFSSSYKFKCHYYMIEQFHSWDWKEKWNINHKEPTKRCPYPHGVYFYMRETSK